MELWFQILCACWNREINGVKEMIRQKEASILNTQKLDLKAYLMTPMQRVTRYPLLMSAVVKLCPNDEEKSKCQAALEALKSVCCSNIVA